MSVFDKKISFFVKDIDISRKYDILVSVIITNKKSNDEIIKNIKIKKEEENYNG